MNAAGIKAGGTEQQEEVANWSTRRALLAKVARLESGNYDRGLTSDDVRTRVERWLARVRVESLGRLTLPRLEEQLEDLGTRVLLLSPTVSAEIERAVTGYLTKGLPTEDQQQARDEQAERELQRCRDELARDVQPGGTIVAVNAQGQATARVEFTYMRQNTGHVITVWQEVNGVRTMLSPEAGWVRAGRPDLLMMRTRLLSGVTPRAIGVSPLGGAWISLAESRSWELNQSAVGSKTAVLEVDASTDAGRTAASTATFKLVVKVG